MELEARNVPCLQCDRCGEIVLLVEVVEKAIELLVQDLIRQLDPLRPEEIRFLRQRAHLEQTKVAKLMRVPPIALKLWEDGKLSMGADHDRRLREVLQQRLAQPPATYAEEA